MNKHLKRSLKYLAQKIEDVLDKDKPKPIPERDFSVVWMKASGALHILMIQGEISDLIPEDGSFKGMIVIDNLTQVQAEEMMKRYNLEEQGFKRVE
jgi:hypothetical protein